jgi:hypothetical protein
MESRKHDSTGECEHCRQQFRYSIYHCGFSDCCYAYCEKCGSTAVLSMWNPVVKKLPGIFPWQHEINEASEPYILACECGGHFRAGASPRCPHCYEPLSADLATEFIERNASGTKKGWRWQRSWHGTYCIAIENKIANDNYNLPGQPSAQ